MRFNVPDVLADWNGGLVSIIMLCKLLPAMAVIAAALRRWLGSICEGLFIARVAVLAHSVQGRRLTCGTQL